MASSEGGIKPTPQEMADLEAKFEEFVSLSNAGKATTDKKLMNSKACGKMVKDLLPKEVMTIADASIFPKCKERGKQHMHIDKFNDFIHGCAWEYTKSKTKNSKLAMDDPKVVECLCDFRTRIIQNKKKVAEVKISKTGNVGELTDTKKYTGAHKERFDEEGKGKGVKGREDICEHKGYTHNYKNEGSYDKKH